MFEIRRGCSIREQGVPNQNSVFKKIRIEFSKSVCCVTGPIVAAVLIADCSELRIEVASILFQQDKQNYMVQLTLNQNAKKTFLSRIVNSAIQKCNSNYVLTFVIVKIQKVKSTHILIIDFLTILRGKDFQDVINVLDIIKGLIKV